jgi:hypothetical protein
MMPVLPVALCKRKSHLGDEVGVSANAYLTTKAKPGLSSQLQNLVAGTAYHVELLFAREVG